MYKFRNAAIGKLGEVGKILHCRDFTRLVIEKGILEKIASK
jgi:hypothetical protein